jgi:hypothetical protein
MVKPCVIVPEVPEPLLVLLPVSLIAAWAAVPSPIRIMAATSAVVNGLKNGFLICNLRLGV